MKLYTVMLIMVRWSYFHFKQQILFKCVVLKHVLDTQSSWWFFEFAYKWVYNTSQPESQHSAVLLMKNQLLYKALFNINTASYSAYIQLWHHIGYRLYFLKAMVECSHYEVDDMTRFYRCTRTNTLIASAARRLAQVVNWRMPLRHFRWRTEVGAEVEHRWAVGVKIVLLICIEQRLRWVAVRRQARRVLLQFHVRQRPMMF